jgi:phosphate transport system substrate-binding protein
MRNALALLVRTLTALAVAGCSNSIKENEEQTCPATRIVLTGSSTMAPLMAAIAKRFQASHSGVEIEVTTGGSDRGVSDARDGLANIGMASRPLRKNEEDLLGFPIARDGICLLVHKANPIPALSKRQVASVFTGKTTNWKDVAGRDAHIAVVNRQPGRSEVEFFTHYFGINYDNIRERVRAGDNVLCIQAVADNPDAITYVSVGEAERDAHKGMTIKLLPMEGVSATSENVRNGNYPMSRPLTLVTKELPAGMVKAFLEFALSSQVTDLVKEFGFVPYVD